MFVVKNLILNIIKLCLLCFVLFWEDELYSKYECMEVRVVTPVGYKYGQK